MEFTNTPYVEHPLRNTLRLMRAGVDDNTTLIASILHDVLEDAADRVVETSGKPHLTAEDILAELFSENVVAVVQAVTNDKVKPAHVTQKHEVYRAKIASIVEAMRTTGDPRAFLVKLSDLLDNAASLPAAYALSDAATQAKMLKRLRKYAYAMPVVAEGVVTLQELLPGSVNTLLHDATYRMVSNLLTLATTTNEIDAQQHLTAARKLLEPINNTES